MISSFRELRDKEVINIKTGEKVGYIDDVEIDTRTAEVAALVIYGRPRIFGIFGRGEDVVVKCSEIDVVGPDAILVRIDEEKEHTRKKKIKIDFL